MATWESIIIGYYIRHQWEAIWKQEGDGEHEEGNNIGGEEGIIVTINTGGGVCGGEKRRREGGGVSHITGSDIWRGNSELQPSTAPFGAGGAV